MRLYISGNALALFFCITVTSVITTANAFVPRPPMSQIPVNANENTALGYIKEGYDTGIGPDFLNKKRVVSSPTPVGEDVEVGDVVIDAVVVEEKSAPAPRKASRVGSYRNDIAVDDVDVLKNLKRKLSSSSPRDMFPDLHHEENATPPSIFDSTSAKTVQGGSLRTWSMEIPEIDHAQVLLKNFDGNPLHAQIDIWDGPDRAPMKLAIYCANTSDKPFSCVIPTPGISKQSIGIKNSGPLEFPIEAVVIADVEAVRAQREHQQESNNQHQHQYSHQHQHNQRGGLYKGVDPNPVDITQREARSKPTSGFGLFAESLRSLGDMRKIDGTSPVDFATQGKKNNEEAFQFERNVDSVQVLIETNGLACQARIEVTYDRNNDHYSDDEIQQVIELQIEDGKERPFFAVIETPLRCPTLVNIVNLDPYSAFPITACVEPYTIGCDENETEDCHLNDGCNRSNNNDKKNGMDIIDASIEETTEVTEDKFHSVPDITIPATDADYDFDEDFFFACGTN